MSNLAILGGEPIKKTPFPAWPQYDESERQALMEVLESRIWWRTPGTKTLQFEREFAAYHQAKHGIAVTNGTAALEVVMAALGIYPGDEVIVPALTFAATANVVRHVGARPVFADIISVAEPTLDPYDAAGRLTSRTRAIMPVHYAGFACRMAPIQRLAQERFGPPVAIIEDAAHALGGRGEGNRPLGTIGDAGAFSFFSNKNLVTGEGGAVAATDPKLAERIRSLRSHGLTSQTWTRHSGGGSGYDVLAPGLNYRPTEITAALGLAQLAKFDAMQARRRRLHELYCEGFRPCEDVLIPFTPEGACDPAAIAQNASAQTTQSAYHIFPILLPGERVRDYVAGELRRRGIQTSHHYGPLHTMTAYRDGAGRLPKCEEFAARELTLPLHPKMSDNDVFVVVDAVIDSLKSQCVRERLS